MIVDCKAWQSLGWEEQNHGSRPVESSAVQVTQAKQTAPVSCSTQSSPATLQPFDKTEATLERRIAAGTTAVLNCSTSSAAVGSSPGGATLFHHRTGCGVEVYEGRVDCCASFDSGERLLMRRLLAGKDSWPTPSQLVQRSPTPWLIYKLWKQRTCLEVRDG